MRMSQWGARRPTRVRDNPGEEGFHAGLLGLAAGPLVAQLIAKMELRWARRMARLDCAASAAAYRVERWRALEQRAGERVRAKRGLQLAAAPTVPAEHDGVIVTALRSTIYLATAVMCGLAETSVARATVAPLLGFPTRGPEQWHGWVVALALAALVVPIEAFFRDLDLRATRSASPSARMVARFFLTASALLAAGTIALSGSVRWLFLLRNGQLQAATATTELPPLLQSHPLPTQCFLVGVALSLAIASAHCLVIGFDSLRQLVRGVGALLGCSLARVHRWCGVLVASAMAGAARQRLDHLARAEIGAKAALSSARTCLTLRITYIERAVSQGYAEGVLWRDAGPEAAALSWRARTGRGYRATAAGTTGARIAAGFLRNLRDGSPNKWYEAVPLHEQAREALSAPIRELC